MKRVGGIRVFFVIAFLSNMILPLAWYHSIVEPYITDALWGFKLPFGWAGLIIGVLLVAYPRTPIVKRIDLEPFMILGGFSLLLIWSLTSPQTDFWISLWHGTNHQTWDYAGRSSLAFAPLLISLSSMVAGSMLLFDARLLRR